MRGEVQQPGIVTPGHEGMGAVCGTTDLRRADTLTPYFRVEHAFAQQSAAGGLEQAWRVQVRLTQ
jgi:hypothetical protein